MRIAVIACLLLAGCYRYTYTERACFGIGDAQIQTEKTLQSRNKPEHWDEQTAAERLLGAEIEAASKKPEAKGKPL